MSDNGRGAGRSAGAGPVGKAGAFALAVFVAAGSVGARGAVQRTSPAEAAARRELALRHMDLLQEKGVFDSDGREVEGRLEELVRAVVKAGGRGEKDIVGRVLDRLNYSPSNLAGFPDCAFDRPVGYRLESYGKSSVPGNIEARPEGSAAPLGGIGAGAFERHFNGNFSTWFLKSGWMVEDTVWADQFHIFVNSGGRRRAWTLSTEAPPGGEGLSAWSWRYPTGAGGYFALYPKSGFSYEENKELPVKLAVVQFSPVTAGNYRETSFPVAVFRWVAENRESRPVELSIMLTWENMVGWEAVPAPRGSGQASFVWDRRSAGNFNALADDGARKGVIFRKKGRDVRTGPALSGTMAVAALETPGKTTVHRLTGFDPAGDGGDLWSQFARDGKLPDGPAASQVSAGGRTAAALAVSVKLRPGEKVEIPFVVAWDFPYYEFEPGARHRKRYTDFFGSDGGNAFHIACEGLEHFKEWEKAVDDWQKPVITDKSLPGWFKQALFNELYVLAETSVWDAATGLHTYLESADYLMYGTFDVDAYCWHVLKLWPDLEKRNLEFFAEAVGLEDGAHRVFQYNQVFPREVPEDKKHYYWSVIKERGMVPHDLGSPRKRPWVELNAFDWQNANSWKDLNPKLPLRAWRYFQAAGGRDLDFLKKMLPASALALDTLEAKFGSRQSHLPLNEGIPDQTYDTWRMKGESSYVGFLWLAALKAAVRMAEVLSAAGVDACADLRLGPLMKKYEVWLEQGKAALETLWDEKGGYYHIDASTDDIMTDALFGVWYERMTGLDRAAGGPLLPDERVKRALGTVYEKNVLGFGGGLMGAVNGRRADGRQLLSQQGDEVWVGTAYAFAAHCAMSGMRPEAFRTAFGLYHVVYSPYGQGYFFKTPEAYLDPEEARWDRPKEKYGDRLFRSMKYMRPGAVWALYEALKGHER